MVEKGLEFVICDDRKVMDHLRFEQHALLSGRPKPKVRLAITTHKSSDKHQFELSYADQSTPHFVGASESLPEHPGHAAPKAQAVPEVTLASCFPGTSGP